jgi:hypothetical protein
MLIKSTFLMSLKYASKPIVVLLFREVWDLDDSLQVINTSSLI